MVLADLITMTVEENSSKAAVIFEDEVFTYEQFNARVNSLANALHDIGIKKGDRVAILAGNCPQYREVYVAGIKGGFVVVPLNYRLARPALSYIIDDCKPGAIVFGEDLADVVDSICQESTSIRNLVCIGQCQGKMASYEDLILAYHPEEPRVDAAEEDLAMIMYTSGTTGQPKGAMTTRRNLSAMLPRTGNLLSSSSDRIYLSAMPLHASAGSLTDLTYFVYGATTVLLAAPEPGKILEAIEKYSVTDTFLVPTAINFLLNDPAFGKRDLSSLKRVVYTGSPMPLELLERAIGSLGNIFSQNYGTTESIGISYLDAEDHVIGSKKIASAGKLHPGVGIKVLDDNDRELPAGETGEIVVKSDMVMKGYLGLPEATSETLRDGWFHTGDIGLIDEEGYIYILDRKKDMIISGGYNIYPNEIENVICRHPAVLEVAVIGVPDPEWGESIKALVVRKQGAAVNEKEIIERCKDNLGSYKKPKSVEFVESLPKTSTGKVSKRELRDKHRQGYQSKVH